MLGASALAKAESPRSKRVFDRYGSDRTIQPERAEVGIGLEARPPATRRRSRQQCWT